MKLIVTNAQGTVVATMTPQGQVTYTAGYRPYGQQVEGTPLAGPGYTGHVNDPDSGLVYMQQRYYDPTIGRFISPDPISPTPGNIYNFNRFAYANNNPIVNIDPDGRETGRTLQAEWQMMGAKPNLTPDPVGKVIGGATIGIVALPVAYLIAPEAVVGAARIVIRQVVRKVTTSNGTKDSPRPNGVPRNWVKDKPTKGPGSIYRNPENPKHDTVRFVPGREKSSQPGQRVDHVVRTANGKRYGPDNTPVPVQSQDSHVPVDKFRFVPADKLQKN
ncbi:MAG TPA: RHS repeat-associated core domain-containing protein [Rhodanobacteraceae bacterium]